MSWDAVGALWRSDSMVTLSSPLVQMTVSSESVDFRARFGLGRLLGPWSARTADVASVKASAGFLRNGVEIRLRDGQAWVFFGSWYPQARLLEGFRQAGFPTQH